MLISLAIKQNRHQRGF